MLLGAYCHAPDEANLLKDLIAEMVAATGVAPLLSVGRIHKLVDVEATLTQVCLDR